MGVVGQQLHHHQATTCPTGLCSGPPMTPNRVSPSPSGTTLKPLKLDGTPTAPPLLTMHPWNCHAAPSVGIPDPDDPDTPVALTPSGPMSLRPKVPGA